MLLACGACSRDEPPTPLEELEAALPPPAVAPYPISARGGTPATGPGDRYNHCERIWCLLHGENFFIDHFTADHRGWVLHDERYGDVFSPALKGAGPSFPQASRAMLRLCGEHVHPTLNGVSGQAAIKHTGFNLNLGYSRKHFNEWGTRLHPCCLNGLGHGFVHSNAGKQFRLHDLDYYKANPEWGWQKPFAVRAEQAVAAR
jgi:hypothetical protein